MKKILLAITLVMMVSWGAMAQRNSNGSFFNYWDDVSNGLDKYDDFRNGLDRGPGLPGGHEQGDEPAPLGSGLVVLTALGAGYAVARRKKEN